MSSFSIMHPGGLLMVHNYAPTDIGSSPWNNQAWGLARLPTEAIGTCALTLTGLVPGSEVQAYDSSGNSLGGTNSASNPQVITLPRYISGNPLNIVRIFIASLAYENQDFQYTLVGDSGSIPVFQRRDRTYKNPT